MNKAGFKYLKTGSSGIVRSPTEEQQSWCKCVSHQSVLPGCLKTPTNSQMVPHIYLFRAECSRYIIIQILKIRCLAAFRDTKVSFHPKMPSWISSIYPLSHMATKQMFQVFYDQDIDVFMHFNCFATFRGLNLDACSGVLKDIMRYSVVCWNR